MRKKRDAGETRERVLAAAESEFARKGFSGTSLNDISKTSGISTGLILHHFESKQNLYHQVLEQLSNRYAQDLVYARQAAGNPAEVMEKTLTASFNFWLQDQAYRRISAWADLEGQTDLTEKEVKLTSGLAQEVTRMQQEGILDDRYHPVVFLTMVIGPIHFWVRYRDKYVAALNLSQPAEELDRLFLEQLVRLVKEMATPPVDNRKE
jgi:TetR/AcrR family transcriptional regulator